jgi:predicted secreted protein
VKSFLLLLAALAIGLFAGCIQVETYSDEGQGIDTGINQQFVIALGANPTTGYDWEASYDETMIELVEKIYKEVAKEGVVGAGGVDYFRFEALKTGRTQITLVYKRAWEEEIIAQKVFAVHIR